MIPNSKLIIITGPTASGKTALSLKLAKKFNGEIVSADSRQVYKEMDIGTAKSQISSVRGRQKDAKGIRHYLIDIKNPRQSYTLGQYKRDAVKSINEIIKKGKTPFMVGGTALYISAIINNLEIPEVKPNKTLRKKLRRQMEKAGVYYLYGKLSALDPEAIYIVDKNNPRRLIRALEIVMTTKKSLSHFRKKGKPLFDTLLLGMNAPIPQLEKNIDKRTEDMFKKGLRREVQKLVKKYGKRRTPFDAIGYREVISHLDGDITLAEAKEQIKKDTRRFARKQMSWFRKMPIKWVRNKRDAEKEIKKFLQK